MQKNQVKYIQVKLVFMAIQKKMAFIVLLELQREHCDRWILKSSMHHQPVVLSIRQECVNEQKKTKNLNRIKFKRN